MQKWAKAGLQGLGTRQPLSWGTCAMGTKSQWPTHQSPSGRSIILPCRELTPVSLGSGPGILHYVQSDPSLPGAWGPPARCQEGSPTTALLMRSFKGLTAAFSDAVKLRPVS